MNPKDAQMWITIAAGIIVWAFTAGVIWTRLNFRIDENKKDAKVEAERVAEHGENERQKLRAEAEQQHIGLREQINGLGGRLTEQAQSCAALGGRVESAERQLSATQQQGSEVHTRLGRVEARVDAMDSHITEFKLELFQKLADLGTTIQRENNETRQMLQDRDARLRERLARVEERKGIPHEERD